MVKERPSLRPLPEGKLKFIRSFPVYAPHGSLPVFVMAILAGESIAWACGRRVGTKTAGTNEISGAIRIATKARLTCRRMREFFKRSNFDTFISPATLP